MNVLTDLKNRGVRDVFIVVCDAPLGLPDAVNTVFPAAIVQACVIHLIRATVRGHFPTEQAALKCLYLVTRGLDPTGTGHARWMTKWKPALTAFAVTFADRMPAAENL
jgi:transposase-like protein